MEKPKRQLTPAQLEGLARGRKLAYETRLKKKAIREEEMKHKKTELDKKFEAIIENKKKDREKQQQVEETDVPIYPEAKTPQEEPSSEDEPEPAPKIKKSSKSKAPPKINLNIDDLSTPYQPQEPNYKQMYYKYKLDALTSQQQKQQQQQQFQQQYAQLPSQAHAIDIARDALKSKANKMVYESVYKQLFP